MTDNTKGSRASLHRAWWLDTPAHHNWLERERNRLVTFHARHALKSPVGFAPLDRQGEPDLRGPRDLYLTARMIHCFAVEHLLGRPGAASIARHGIDALNGPFLDRENGGWFHRVAADGKALDATKGGYGHAFVLLAAATASIAQIAGSDDLLDQADYYIDQYFWCEDEGAAVESRTADWKLLESGFRGQNANMHLVEALMGAHEATGDSRFQRRAESIAELIIAKHAATNSWRVPEYFDAAWNPNYAYNADRPDDPFRPYGSLPGHSMEWARLLIQLRETPGSEVPWAPDAATALFDTAIRDAWTEPEGGLPYTVDTRGTVLNSDRMHWAMAECIGAATYLARTTDDSRFEAWYRRFWEYVGNRMMDPDGGSWWHQVNHRGEPTFGTWPGKPDLYHAYQATLYARQPIHCGLAVAARTGQIN